MSDSMDDFAEESGDESSSRDERPITEENTPEGDGETIHVPTGMLQGKEFKEGDEIVLKVVATGDDGIEVAYAKGEDSEESGEPAMAGKEPSDMDQLDSQY